MKRDLSGFKGNTKGNLEGKQKVKLDALIAQYNGEFTINSLLMAEKGKFGNAYCLFTIEEDDTIFSSGAGGFIDLYAYLLNECSEGDFDDMQASLKDTPLRISVGKIRTRAGNTYTKVTALYFICDEGTVDATTGEIVTVDGEKSYLI